MTTYLRGVSAGDRAARKCRLAAQVAGAALPIRCVRRGCTALAAFGGPSRTGDPGAPEAAADLLHACVDLVAATRGRVPALRIRRARLELRPWHNERFVTDLDDHMHTALIGI
ncbi:hypothetical protein [Thermomonospora cellulosilytica]|uniref:Uncharacterized protein n=1 Tax=Thermomonospora cellulosilytica TaxID=1411118 RepID=A0A7W3MUJ4_9ACTN|nr:hypothetical protein [Thermomonospora cellulosilytica]MBA9002118.1 hypothetical protein [Thermomonospora cellulosilytica]